MLQLSKQETEPLVSQNVIPSERSLGGYLPYAFTEQGVAMLSSVLRSERAVQVNILFFPFRAVQPGGSAGVHDAGNFPSHVELAGAVRIVFGAVGVEGFGLRRWIGGECCDGAGEEEPRMEHEFHELILLKVTASSP